jgi:hypothetical protein
MRADFVFGNGDPMHYVFPQWSRFGMMPLIGLMFAIEAM